MLVVRLSGLRCQAMKAAAVQNNFNMGRPTPMVRRVHALPASVIHIVMTFLVAPDCSLSNVPRMTAPRAKPRKRSSHWAVRTSTWLWPKCQEANNKNAQVARNGAQTNAPANMAKPVMYGPTKRQGAVLAFRPSAWWYVMWSTAPWGRPTTRKSKAHSPQVQGDWSVSTGPNRAPRATAAGPNQRWPIQVSA